MYKTLAELFSAYQTNTVVNPLILDNDQTAVYTDTGEMVFEMHPDQVLREALRMLDIPHDEA